LVDFSSELLANAGWLGGGDALDSHQEGVLPVAILGALVIVGLVITLALRAGRGDRTRYNEWSGGQRVLVAIVSLVATFVVIVLMEAYEMRFGEVSALDPRSVFAEHWPAVLIGYAIVSIVVGRIVAFALGVAVAAGELAAHAIVRFLHRDRAPRATRRCDGDAFGTRIVHRPLVIARGKIGLRGPPAGQLLPRLQLLT
jgi:hypothetical protein